MKLKLTNDIHKRFKKYKNFKFVFIYETLRLVNIILVNIKV